MGIMMTRVRGSMMTSNRAGPQANGHNKTNEDSEGDEESDLNDANVLVGDALLNDADALNGGNDLNGRETQEISA